MSPSGVVLMTEYAATVEDLGVEFGLTQSLAESLAAGMREINQAETPDQAVQAATRFSEALLKVFGNADNIPDKLRESAQAALELARAGGAIIAQDEAGQRLAQEMLADLREENTLRRKILQFGEDSVQVAAHRAGVEKQAFEEMLASLDVSEDLKEELSRAFRWSQQLAETDMASGISAAGEEAGKLARKLGIAVTEALSLMNLRDSLASKVYSGRGGDPRDFMPGGSRYGQTSGVVPKSPSNGGGGARVSAQKTFDQLVFDQLVNDASGTMSGLELAIAAVNEKVAAGLLSAAEGQVAIDVAITGAAGSIGDLIPQLERAAKTAGPDAAAKVEEMRRALKGLVGDLKATSSELGKTFSDSLGQSMTEFQIGAKTASEAFSDFGGTVLNQINRIIAQRFTARFITPLVDGLLSFLPGVLGGAVGGAIGGAGAAFGAPQPNIVARPGSFARGIRAGGAVARSSSGASAGAAGAAGGARQATPVNIVVNNNGQPVEASAQETGSGESRLIKVMIEQVEAGVAANIARGVGPVAGAMTQTFGLARQPR